MQMHSLTEDVPRAITNVLSTHNWRDRKQLIDSLFFDDVHFWHLFHDCKNKRELFGVYQMWGETASVLGRQIVLLAVLAAHLSTCRCLQLLDWCSLPASDP